MAAPADALAEPLGSLPKPKPQGPTDVRKRPPPLCAKRVRLLAVSAVTDSTALASTPQSLSNPPRPYQDTTEGVSPAPALPATQRAPGSLYTPGRRRSEGT